MPAPLVVQKFGGSSLADADRIKRVARRIARERAAGHDLVVVVSAMGDTTDELLGLAAAITDDPDPRELDVLLATGEHQSATLVSMALHALGVAAISLTGAAGRDHDRRPLRQGADRRHRAAPRPRRRSTAGKVVIVAGFQGQSALGRRRQTRSRRSAAAAATRPPSRWPPPRADRCQIFTDVRGIFTADPRLVATPASCRSSATRRCSSSPTRAPRSCRSGRSSSAGSTASSSRSSARSRTRPARSSGRIRSWSSATRSAASPTTGTSPRSPSSPSPTGPGVARSIFDPLAEAGVNVDMIVQNVGHGGATDLSFTVPRVELAAAKKALEPIVRELGARELTTDASVAKVSIVGAGLHNAPGLRGAHVRDARRRRRQHRDDLDLGGPDHLHHRRGRARDRAARPP